MGSAASKAPRKYPEVVGKVVEHVKKPSPSLLPSASNLNGARLAENYRSEAIERDAKDPHLVANLNKLGPVRVDHNVQSIHPDGANANALFKSRDLPSTTITRNRLYGYSISEMLDKHKSVQTRDELVKLAEEFKIDLDKLEKLVRCVNSPSIEKASIRPAPGSKQGEDLWVANAVWVEARTKS